MAKGKRVAIALLALGAGIFLLLGVWVGLVRANESHYSRVINSQYVDIAHAGTTQESAEVMEQASWCAPADAGCLLLAGNNSLRFPAHSSGPEQAANSEAQVSMAGTSANVINPSAEQPAQRLPGPSPFFIENVGQFEQRARFQLYGGQAGTLYFSDDGISLTVLEPITDTVQDCLLHSREQDCVRGAATEARRKGVNIKLRFTGANPNPQVVGIDPLDTKVSYFIGNDPNRWYREVPVYAGIRYENVYPGIDLEYRGSDGGWEANVIARPGTDTSVIGFSVEGADSYGSDADRRVHLETVVGEVVVPEPLPSLTRGERQGMIFSKPLFYENELWTTQSSEGSALVYSTFVGGWRGQDPSEVSVDKYGNGYVLGTTTSPDFPTTPGAFDTSYYGPDDLVVFKLNASGSALEYSTFIGGSAFDLGNSIAVDADGNAYITGLTSSTDFPTTPGAFDTSHNGNGDYDVFVVKFNASGSSLEYST